MSTPEIDFHIYDRELSARIEADDRWEYERRNQIINYIDTGELAMGRAVLATMFDLIEELTISQAFEAAVKATATDEKVAAKGLTAATWAAAETVFKRYEAQLRNHYETELEKDDVA